jgi:hypothetical protein
MQTDIVKWKCRHDTAPFPSLNLLLKDEIVELPAVKMLLLGGGQEQHTVKFGRCMAGDLSKHRMMCSPNDVDTEDFGDDISPPTGFREQ